MRFALSAEQRGFAASLGALLGGADVPSIARAWSVGDYAPGRKLWLRLADAGVTALGTPDSGADPVDLVVGFEELGRAAVPGPFVESVAVLPVLLAGTPAAAQLTAIASGDTVATVAIPPRVPFALDGAAADVVFAVEGAAVHIAAVEGERASVDAARRIAEVVPGEEISTTADVARALDLGALATAAQILGAGSALLDMTTAYAGQRVQFGRPIGQFQAVKHQLADVHVGLEFARPLLYAAALAVARDSPDRTRDVSAAKVACTDAAYRASRVALQVHGAVGYTAEYDLVLWLTKVRALVSAWGTPAEHRAAVLAALA